MIKRIFGSKEPKVETEFIHIFRWYRLHKDEGRLEVTKDLTRLPPDGEGWKRSPIRNDHYGFLRESKNISPKS